MSRSLLYKICTILCGVHNAKHVCQGNVDSLEDNAGNGNYHLTSQIMVISGKTSNTGVILIKTVWGYRAKPKLCKSRQQNVKPVQLFWFLFAQPALEKHCGLCHSAVRSGSDIRCRMTLHKTAACPFILATVMSFGSCASCHIIVHVNQETGIH